MVTLREKITFACTAIAYLVFHLRLGTTLGDTAYGTMYQILLTAPYAIGFTYIIAVVFRRLSGSGWPPWDRLLRIFFTIGILFAFFFALYEYAERGGGGKGQGKEAATVSRSAPDSNLPAPSRWA
jgi:hypothetical protein